MRNTYIILIIILIVALGGFLYWQNTMRAIPAPESDSTAEVPNPFPTGTSSGSESVNPDTDSGTVSGTVQTDIRTTPAVKSFTITGKNYSFAPGTITVNKGDTVKITFKNENGMHNLIIDEFDAATKTIQGGASDTIEFTADKAGSFQYYCSVGAHRANGMWGTLIVK